MSFVKVTRSACRTALTLSERHQCGPEHEAVFVNVTQTVVYVHGFWGSRVSQGEFSVLLTDVQQPESILIQLRGLTYPHEDSNPKSPVPCHRRGLDPEHRVVDIWHKALGMSPPDISYSVIDTRSSSVFEA